MNSQQAPVGGTDISVDVFKRPDGLLSRATLGSVRSSLATIRVPMDVARVVAVWAAWFAVVCAFQIVVQARLAPQRPDNTLAWTHYTTEQAVLDRRPLLSDPNMNEHVAYDSEYYISIAANGYDDPNAQAYSFVGGQRWSGAPGSEPGAPKEWTSLNYAFLPGYSMAMRPMMAIESVLPLTSDLTPIGKATLAGIVVSALGGLLAMLALARLMGAYARRRKSGDAASDPEAGTWGGLGGLRAAFYLLVFPTGFYLAQVYTEGLFIGLAFMACALAVEKRFVTAAILAVLATLVKPAGMFLALPLAWAAFEALRSGELRLRDWRIVIPVASILAPVVAFGAWFLSPLGQNWKAVEDAFFTRYFDPIGSWNMWVSVWDSLLSGVDKTSDASGFSHYFGGGPLPSSSTVYLTLELLAIALAVVSSVWLLRRMPGVALFGLAVLVFSFSSTVAAPWGMDRYVLAVPAIFLMLAWLGRRVVVDRVWVLASTLLMGMSAMLFTFGFWVS